jgi:acetyl esterase
VDRKNMGKKVATAVVSLLIAVASAFKLSLWPLAMVYRRRFDRGGAWMNDRLAKHVPRDVLSDIDLRYGSTPKEMLDIHRPEPDSALHNRPVVVWVHGGGFLAGDKAHVANYLKIIASAGYVTAGVNYSLAPAARHPTPTRQVNAAIAHLTANAQRFGIDAGRILLAGDSAGAQIAAQLAIALTDPSFAKSIGVDPAIPAKSLRGVALYCGLYDPDRVNPEDAEDPFLHVVASSYLGIRTMRGADRPTQFSIVQNLNPNMAPLFISAGNGDRLLPHSKALAAAAASARIPAETLFFPADHSPAAPHEYQFHLDSRAGQIALRRSLKFFAARCSDP